MATTEMNKLDAALTEMGIEHTYDREFKSGEQIVVTKNGEYQWDAICTADDVLKMMKEGGQCV
jgi:hypothetical protein